MAFLFIKMKQKQYGLDFSGFSTQAVFFDYDMDGDLDMYLLNHSIHQNGTFGPRRNFLRTYSRSFGRSDLSGMMARYILLMLQRKQALIVLLSDMGLGIAVADINLDG